jgi:MSHA pilin protein MshA
MKRFSSASRGFTLIELIIVIAIVGVLAAVAIPKFTNLSTSAQQAALDNLAGALGSASATNYAIQSGGLPGGVSIGNCTAIGGLLQGGLDAAYAITSATIGANATALCTVTHTATTLTKTFTGHGI